MKEPSWLLKSAILAAHDLLLAEHGGAIGLRDAGLLDSALAHPQNLFAYGTCDIFDLAAAYGFGIVKNHPFIDGNKRAGFVATRVFLLRHGYDINASKKEKVEMFENVAASKVSEKKLAEWLRTNAISVEIGS